MPMRRREKHVTGWVRFPVEDPQWEFSREGGMFVRLMVIDGRNHKEEHCWMECCGGTVEVQLDETPQVPDALMQRLWPGMFDGMGRHRTEPTPKNYNSVPCLATLVIGSTGWAGWSEEKNTYWTCTEDDLTEEGKALVASLRRLYPGHELVLTTWLDT